VRGDEARVVDAFCAHLERQGWTVEREVKYADVKATRGGQTLFAEAKGRTTAIGLDVDTLYGQLLRRLPEEADPNTVLAVVVPEEAVKAALRVPHWVRSRLGVDVYAVSNQGDVAKVATSVDR
jgi:hypothetical protein